MMDHLAYWEEQRELARAVGEDSGGVWRAPSPVHALAWLRVHYYWPSSVAHEKRRGDGSVQLTMQRRPFFRGHARSDWRPAPSLLRHVGEERDRLRRVATLAASVVDLEFGSLYSADGTQNWPPFDSGAGMCAVQHYGVKTDLLDWTANPSVAVHFATCGESSSASEEAAVLVADIGSLRGLGAHLLMPPVYIERLYLQRGLFTRMNDEMIAALDSKCTKVVFPAQPRLPALLTDDGERTVEADLLPYQEWFHRLKEWAEVHADDDGLLADPVGASLSFEALHGRHPAIAHFDSVMSLFFGYEHTSPIIAYIEELAGRNKMDGKCYDPLVLDRLAEDNPKLFHWLGEAGFQFPSCY